MKQIPLATLAVALGLGTAFTQMTARAANPCDAAGKKIQAEVAAKPERVLVLVEDAIVQNEGCACEIVKGAIIASKASARLVGEIVFTAVGASRGVAATVAECAIAVAPDAANEIKAALKRALGSSAKIEVAAAPAASAQATAATDSTATAEKVPTGKNPAGKNPPVEAKSAPRDDDGWASASAVAISGVYLIMPGLGGSAPPLPPKETITRVVIRRPPPKNIIVRPPPVTPAASTDFPEPDPAP